MSEKLIKIATLLDEVCEIASKSFLDRKLMTQDDKFMIVNRCVVARAEIDALLIASLSTEGETKQ